MDLGRIAGDENQIGNSFGTKGNRINEVAENKGIENDGGVLKGKPFSKTPTGKAVEVEGEGVLFEVAVIGFLEFGVIGFSFGVEGVFAAGITLGGVVINEIVNGDVGDGEDKNFEVEDKKDDGDRDEGDEAVDTGLFNEIEGKGGGVGKIADSLDGGMTFFFRFGLEVRKKEIVDVEDNPADNGFKLDD